ncbi:SpoIVB peptidase S55 domain-containing protein [Selenomonas sputigena]|uniref:SpoIVB peptidase S55 domain-containing protein n=1 Tax=Selenomonas sputigena TaxID=69823 RepID=A0ABV3X3H8_9FIRM
MATAWTFVRVVSFGIAINEVMYLRKFKKRMLSLCLSLSLSASMAAASLPPTLPLSDVYPGMEGTAYTVVDDSGDIVPFHVDIVGTYDEGSSTSRIMARASGPVVEQTGGTLQGMSGSPIYVDGALVGALSAGLKGMSLYTFFITPIDEMLRIWDMPDPKNAMRPKQVQIAKADKPETAEEEAAPEAKEKSAVKKAVQDDGPLLKLKNPSPKPEKKKEKKPSAGKKEEGGKDAAKREEKPSQEAEKPVGSDAGKPAEAAGTGASASRLAKEEEPAGKAERKEKTALFLAGFGRNGTSYMQEKLAGLGVKTGDLPAFGIPNPGTHVVYDGSLEPGSAVGVAVVYGDFSVGATGTVTAVDGNRVLAFGHPFLHKGNVNYFLTDAKVIGTISGPTDGMKIATIGNIIGRVNQDREAGVGGLIGSFPSTVPMRVRVHDASLGANKRFAVQIAYDEDFLPVLTSGIAYAAIGKTSDTVGEGTANVKFTIHSDAGEDGKIERSNMYYNASDVGKTSVAELAQLMTLLCQNTDKETDVTSIDVDVEMENTRKTASLISAVPDKPSAKPGETIHFRTTIKPFRKENEVISIPFRVPERQDPGVLRLDLRGGGLVPVTASLLQNALGIDTSVEEDKTQTTAEKVGQFLEMGRNNEIIIGPALAPPAAEEKGEKRPKGAKTVPLRAPEKKVDLLGQKAKRRGNPLETKFETGYIIDNVIHTSLLVEARDK